MNLVSFHNIVLAIAALLGIAHPYIAALLTKTPSWLTGVITMTLSAASGLVGELIAAPDNYNWQRAASTAVTAWLFALGTHFSQIAGTPQQARLHATGVKGSAPAAPVA